MNINRVQEHFEGIYLLVFKCFETKGREAIKSTIISSSKKPFEETPQEAEGEELSECSHLFPIGIDN